MRPPGGRRVGEAKKRSGDLATLLRAYERKLILAALHRAGGNQRRAAAALGLLPTTLNEKLKRLGIGVVRSAVDLDPPGAGERERVLAALTACKGHMDRAAARLGLTRGKLRESMQRLGIGVARAITDLEDTEATLAEGPAPPGPSATSPGGWRPASRSRT